MGHRHQLIVFHEDPAVCATVAGLARRWHMSRVTTLRELETQAKRRAPEVLVTGARPHGVPLQQALDAAGDHRPLRLFLWIHPGDDAVQLLNSIVDDPRGLYVASVDAQKLNSQAETVERKLTEALYRLRVRPYHQELQTGCVAGSRISGTPFERLPGLLLRAPWSYRRPTELTRDLRAPADLLLRYSKELGYQRTDQLVFRIRLELIFGLFRCGPYSWAEARETFGEIDPSNFGKRLARWLGVEVRDSDLRNRLSQRLELVAG